MQKIRVRFHKDDVGKFTSHLDLNRLFIRSLCRAQIPVVYTEGFNPHPHIVFGPPLPLGFTSSTEIVDFSVTEDMEFDDIKDRLGKALPIGFIVEKVYDGLDKLNDIAYVSYHCLAETEKAIESDTENSINELFSPERTLLVMKKSKRKEKEIDINKMISYIDIKSESENSFSINTKVVCSPQENLNPQYIIKAIEENIKGLGNIFTRFHRVTFWLKNGQEFDKNA